jgi:hypothetical protein
MPCHSLLHGLVPLEFRCLTQMVYRSWETTIPMLGNRAKALQGSRVLCLRNQRPVNLQRFGTEKNVAIQTGNREQSQPRERNQQPIGDRPASLAVMTSRAAALVGRGSARAEGRGSNPAKALTNQRSQPREPDHPHRIFHNPSAAAIKGLASKRRRRLGDAC